LLILERRGIIVCLKKLIEQFELLRNEMNEAGNKYGLKHPLVLRKSKELDKLHIQILHLQKREKKHLN